MHKLNQRGVTHIFLILLLLAGLAVAVYLVQQKTNILPKAFENLGGTTTCGFRISKFSVSNPCSEVPDGFKSAQYSCQITIETQIAEPAGQSLQSLSTEETCRSLQEWISRAQSACSAMCPNTNSSLPIPIPTPILLPFDPDRLMGVCSSAGTSATLSWNPISGVADYFINIKDMTDSKILTPIFVNNATTTTIPTIAGHNYQWNVRSCNAPNSCQGEGTTAYFDCPSRLFPGVVSQ